MVETTSTPAPETRGQRYRQRKRAGSIIVPVEVNAQAAAGLAELGVIDPDGPRDREAIKDGLALLIVAVSEDGLVITDDWIDEQQ